MKIKKLTWDEHGKLFAAVTEKVKAYISREKIHIDAVVPILRGAGFLGTYLAYRLSVLRILPVQYKYLFPKEGIAELRKLLFSPSMETLGEAPTVLLVEEDYCYGNASIEAAKDLRTELPGCTIVFVAEQADYTYRNAIAPYVDKVIFGRYTNHCEELTDEECAALHIDMPRTQAAWENPEEESAITENEQWQYGDLQAVQEKSETKFSVAFDGLKSQNDNAGSAE